MDFVNTNKYDLKHQLKKSIHTNLKFYDCVKNMITKYCGITTRSENTSFCKYGFPMNFIAVL